MSLCRDQPRHGRDGQDLRHHHRRRARGRDRRSRRSAPHLVEVDHGRGARGPHPPRRRAAHRAPPGAGGAHRARDGQADRAGARRGRLRRGHLRVLRRPLAGLPEGRADPAPRGRWLGGHPPLVARGAARRHAVELPVLPGRPLRRPEPHHRQHDPAQARRAVPRVRRRDAADLPRRGLPGRRLRERLRLARPARAGHRGPARAGRLAHRLRARRRRGRRDRRPPPEEGRARARRLGPLHPALDRRPRRHRAERDRRPARQQRPVLQRGQALHRRRRAVPALPREVHREDRRDRGDRPDLGRLGARPAVVAGVPPRDSTSRSSARSSTARRSRTAAPATARSSRRPC